MEKSSLEKIRRLLEISELERYYKVLLTPDNITTVRHNPAPYTLPVIPSSLESRPTDQTEPVGVARIESKEADPTPSAL